MIRGMTGQASRRFSTPVLDAEMDLRSVNSRFFEFRLKCPPKYAAFEGEARRIISKTLGRGKIELGIRAVEKQVSSQSLINPVLAEAYLNESRILAEKLNIPFNMTIREILSLPQVLNTENGELDEETINRFGAELQSLIDSILPMMHTEGKSTVQDIEKSLSLIDEAVLIIKDTYPIALERYKQQLLERVLEVSSLKAPEERLAVEIEIFASRTCINEEIVRLVNHLKVTREILSGKRDGGSKELDFIAQELNRETNTIASKSSDYKITEKTIIIKSEIEKIREHYRNIV
ncbi:MAG: YicC/YloC family endoribonuclease [Brevinema sp.]